jgi:hypothetical protein
MQPRQLALIITILPLLASNGAYLLSAYDDLIPWCIPYFDGCTTISRAARSGNAIFIFRAAMISYGVMLIWFWIYAQHWLDLLYGHKTKMARIILWLGIVGAVFLIVYVDFLGSTGDINRFMRRYGVMVFYTFTPLAQLLMLKQHYALLSSQPDKSTPLTSSNTTVFRYQLIILLLMLIIAFIGTILDITHHKTYESENIVEWNFSFLLNMYFLGMVFIWKNYRYRFSATAP